MQQPDPTIKTVSSDEASDQFRRLIREVGDGTTRAMIEEDGQAVAALVSIADLQRLQRNDDFKVFEEISQAFADESLEDIESEVASAVQQVRKRRREEASGKSSGQ